MTDYNEIFERNKAWAHDKVEHQHDYFVHLSSGQQPDYLYIGCSDSRVPANEIMGLDAGEVFVHRNIANMVPSNDLNVSAVINYAVVHLGVKNIIVCGHTNCGGVKAAMQPKDLGILNSWLRNIRDVYRLHHGELDAIKDDDARYNRLIELNVIEQCLSVIKMAEVQTSFLKNGYPKVSGWVFDMSTGLIKDLEINFTERLKDIQAIYRLENGALV
ncbi:MAG: carbonic anhydrase [Candidatus Sericytochromatia bacterium]